MSSRSRFNNIKVTKEWYEKSYEDNGFRAQRLYPNEELIRFLGRNFLSKYPKDTRKTIKVLEIGCGYCGNLWAIAKEGFAAYGIDISQNAIDLGKQVLEKWDTTADLRVGSMTELPFENSYFDIIIDVFSAYCLPEDSFSFCLDEVARCLKEEGKFFSYSPSTQSDNFKSVDSSDKIDQYTLSGIKRPGLAFSGQNYPFRFVSPEHYRELLEQRNFKIEYLETVSRTYFFQKEYFEFVVVVGVKNANNSPKTI